MSEKINLNVNNPDKRPDWWRELDDGEVIQNGDIVMYLGRFEFTVLAGEYYRPIAPGRKRHNPPHYRLRPWRVMEEGEVIHEGDEWLIGGEAWVPTKDVDIKVGAHRHGYPYRTRRPMYAAPTKDEEQEDIKPTGKRYATVMQMVEAEVPSIAGDVRRLLEEREAQENEMTCENGVCVIDWPEVNLNEPLYPGDAVLTSLGWATVTENMRFTGSHARAKRRVHSCRHCGSWPSTDAWDDENHDQWVCSNDTCRQRGPVNDKSALKWNKQNTTDTNEH